MMITTGFGYRNSPSIALFPFIQTVTRTGGATFCEKEPGHTHSWAYGGVMQAATTCVGEGHMCLNHCLNSFQAGTTP
jgi:hypothetical protein